MRDDLQPGDVLLYRSGRGWLGKALTWGQWSNTPSEAMEYCHAGIVIAPAASQGFEMNPPASHYVLLTKEDWSVIDVWRPVVPVNHAILADWAVRNMGIKYPFTKIAQFLGAGLLARLGLNKASRWMAGLGQTAADHHNLVCSATVCEMLSEATGNAMGWPKETDDMRPADIPHGNLKRV